MGLKCGSGRWAGEGGSEFIEVGRATCLQVSFSRIMGDYREGGHERELLISVGDDGGLDNVHVSEDEKRRRDGDIGWR